MRSFPSSSHTSCLSWNYFYVDPRLFSSWTNVTINWTPCTQYYWPVLMNHYVHCWAWFWHLALTICDDKVEDWDHGRWRTDHPAWIWSWHEGWLVCWRPAGCSREHWQYWPGLSCCHVMDSWSVCCHLLYLFKHDITNVILVKSKPYQDYGCWLLGFQFWF